MKITHVKAKCFLSIGLEPIEIDFTKLKNIINIRGHNFDRRAGSSNGAGKCFGKGTRVLMFDGTTKAVEDVRAGDQLMGDDSTPRKVLSTTTGYDKLYRVVPEKGQSYIVNGDHILALKIGDCQDRHFRHHPSRDGDIYKITVNDYLRQPNAFKNIVKGYRTSVEFTTREVVIDPYILGFWLGARHSETDITTSHEVCHDSVWDWLACRKDKSPFCLSTNNSVLDHLKYYQLIGNKHIPHDYKTNDRGVRLQVLAGLIDSDGDLSHDGFSFTNNNQALAHDVAFLARSVGLAAYVSECCKSCRPDAVETYYHVSISGDLSIVPIRVECKKVTPQKINKDVLKVGIFVEECGDGDYYGFQLDGNKLFLLEDFTVCHNSTVLEMIVYGQYGNVLKEMSHKEVINGKIKKGLEVEVQFEINNSIYKVVRRRKPDGLELWKDNVDISLGGMPSTQAEIERVIGLTYKAFINIAFFGQHNMKSFLKCDAATKRQIVENLLSLEKYNRYCATAKEKKKKIESDLSMCVKNYENTTRYLSVIDARSLQLQQQQSHWKTTRHTELNGLKIKLAAKDDQIKNTDHGAALIVYQQAQEEIPKVRDKIATNTTTKETIEKKYEEIKEKLDSQKSEYHNISLKIDTLDNQIDACSLCIKTATDAIESLSQLKDGEECPVCHGIVGKDNYHHIAEHQESQKNKYQSELKIYYDTKNAIKADRDKLKESILKNNELAKQCVSKITEYRDSIVKLEAKKQMLEKVKEPFIGLNETILTQQRDNIIQLIATKEAEIEAGDPYQEMLVANQKERDEHQLESDAIKNKIKELEARLPYFDYWIKGFGDKGIRSLIIDGMMPALNTRINYWLQFLIDNQIKLTFDHNFDETINSNPPESDPFVYNGLSGGEHMRIDLAISQAFAYLMMLSTGTCPNIVALDEVATNIDRVGMEAIWSTICELSRDRKVIVITHDPDLLQMVESGSSTITVEKRDGFSTAKIQI